jgi:hypothetical protein
VEEVFIMPLNAILPTIISIVALILPGLLKYYRLPDWANSLIAGSTIAILAGLAVWTGGQFSPDIWADWGLFVAMYSSLLAGPLKALDVYLQKVRLPFHPGPGIVDSTLVTNAADPKPITYKSLNSPPPAV